MANKCKFCWTSVSEVVGEQCLNYGISYNKTAKELSADEKKIKNQYFNIRIIGFLAQLVGVVTVLVSMPMFSKFANVPAKMLIPVGVIFIGVFYWYLGYCLRRYRPWSWWVFVISECLLIIENILRLNIIGLIFSIVFLWAIIAAKGRFHFGQA